MEILVSHGLHTAVKQIPEEEEYETMSLLQSMFWHTHDLFILCFFFSPLDRGRPRKLEGV